MTLLLLTRPDAQSRAFATDCRAAGWSGDIAISPLIEIEARHLTADLSPYAALIFTSINGVESVAAQTDLTGRLAIAVGGATAQRAEQAGMTAIAADGTAESLIAMLLADPPATPLCHLRGAHARVDLSERLTANGLPTDAFIVYDQHARALSPEAVALLRGPGPIIVPLFSPRSAVLMAAACKGSTAQLLPVAISAAAAAAWERPETPIVAARPDSAAMLAAVLAGTIS